MIKALTYDEILGQMKEKFRQESGFEADDASDIGIRLRLLAGQLYSQSADISFISRQVFLQSATGEYLDMHAQIRGISRREATKAHGTARFFTTFEEHEDITIPEGTVCAISGDDNQRYVTTAQAILLHGQTQVDVPIEAVNSGRKGNAAIQTITMLVNPPQEITSVCNITALTGGYEQENDYLLRRRLIESYSQMSNGANLQYYKEIAMQNPRVIAANAISSVRGPGTVDVFIDTTEEDYEDIDEIIEELNEAFEIAREIGVDVKAFICDYSADMIVVNIRPKKDYKAKDVIEQAKAELTEYASSLDVGENVRCSQLHRILYGIEGIENYEVASPTGDTKISRQNRFCDTEIYVLDRL
ncbi:MAG: baseplate J/gp47 family protein [Acutalibacteraceae bacterium]|jgi:uncharacterized phage protein gp47/JayE|nr:hypothetical protein [Clostridiales bacterium]